MNTKGSENVGIFQPDNLIADARVSTEVVTVTLAKTSSKTTLKRGSVLAVNATGQCVIAAGTEGTTASYILAEDVTTLTTGTVVAEAYQTGKFVKDSLIVASGYSLSIADVAALRNGGIFVENIVK